MTNEAFVVTVIMQGVLLKVSKRIKEFCVIKNNKWSWICATE